MSYIAWNNEVIVNSNLEVMREEKVILEGISTRTNTCVPAISK
jgi:hypothetical protein